MELRKNIKAPKRYEPELADAPHEVRYMPRGDSKPLFRPPFIDYNPHLPSAAFPTLDSTVPAAYDTAREWLPGKERQDGGRQAETGPFIASDLENMSSVAHPWSITAELEAQDVTLPDIRDTSSMHHSWREKAQHVPAASEESSFMRNGEPFAYAMESSDEDLYEEGEEEVLALADVQKIQKNSRVSWSDLKPANQLEILDGFEQNGFPKEEAWKHLHLSDTDIAELEGLNTRRRQILSQEDAQVRAHVAQINKTLLGGAERYTRKLTQARFQSLWQENHADLINPDELGLDQTTRADLVRARAFLKALGLPQSLAGQWEDPISGARATRPTSVNSKTADTTKAGGGAGAAITEKGLSSGNKEVNHRGTGNPRNGKPNEKRNGNNETPRDRSKHDTMKPTSDATSTVSRKRKSLSRSSLSTPARVGNGRVSVQNSSEQMPNNSNAVKEHTNIEPIRFKTPLATMERVMSTNQHQNDQAAVELTQAASTISTLPQPAYSGTARPPPRTPIYRSSTAGTSQEVQSSNADFKNQASGSSAVSASASDAIEKLRIDALKYRGRSRSQRQEDGFVESGSPIKTKNFRGLSLKLSSTAATSPIQHPRNASLMDSADSRSPGHSVEKLGSRGERSSGSPSATLHHSGSSREARSPAAMQLPARYRDSAVGSPLRSCPAEMRAYSTKMAAWSAGYLRTKTDEALKNEAEQQVQMEAKEEQTQNERSVINEREEKKPPTTKRVSREATALPTPGASSDAGALSGLRRESTISLGLGSRTESGRSSSTPMETDGEKKSLSTQQVGISMRENPDSLSVRPAKEAGNDETKTKRVAGRKPPTGRPRGRPRKNPK